MAQISIGVHKYGEAESRLSELVANYPENYAAIISYAQSLMEAKKPAQAARILLKGSRQFSSDLMMCEQLALAESASQRKDYAYFTEAQCQLLQGRRREALRELKIAKTLAKSDHLIKSRIEAKIKEIVEEH